MALTDPVAFERHVRLASPAGEVWSAVSTMAGVNDELAPMVRMTFPRWAATLADAPRERLGAVAFHSWLLLAGLVPFDRHALRLVQVEDRGPLGGGFAESSTSWLQARWDHEREVEPVDATSCRVTDRLVVVPRVPLARPITAWVVPRIFEHRHRRLVARFGGGTVRRSDGSSDVTGRSGTGVCSE
jgi:hypothetical protein